MIVDKVDDFAVIRRQLRNTFPQLRGSVGVKNRLFGSIGVVRDHLSRSLVELGLAPSSKRRKGLKSGDRQNPGGDLRTIFERAGLAPHGEENLGDKIFGAIGVAAKTDNEMINAKMMPTIQRVHGGLVSCRDRFDEVFVGLCVGRLYRPAKAILLVIFPSQRHSVRALPPKINS
jgi:hypothetical protein